MSKTKKITTMAMFAALSYIVMIMCKAMPPMFSAFPFLSYDAKDVIIVIGGFIMGPLAAFLISFAVSLIEMITISDTNIIGCIMNVASSCAFACVATAIYQKMRSIKGAGIALFAGVVCCASTMLVLNYLLTPVYMKISREIVVKLLVPAILPFNLIKCVLNAALVLIVYKPFVNVLRRANIIEKRRANEKTASTIGVIAVGIFLILVCTAVICILN